MAEEDIPAEDRSEGAPEADSEADAVPAPAAGEAEVPVREVRGLEARIREARPREIPDGAAPAEDGAVLYFLLAFTDGMVRGEAAVP